MNFLTSGAAIVGCGDGPSQRRKNHFDTFSRPRAPTLWAPTTCACPTRFPPSQFFIPIFSLSRPPPLAHLPSQRVCEIGVICGPLFISTASTICATRLIRVHLCASVVSLFSAHRNTGRVIQLCGPPISPPWLFGASIGLDSLARQSAGPQKRRRQTNPPPTASRPESGMA